MKNNIAPKLTRQNDDETQCGEKMRDFEEHALTQLEDMYRTASCLVGTDVQARELVQESLCAAYKSWDELQPWANRRVWLYCVLAKTYINKFRPFPGLIESLNAAYWPEGYSSASRPAIQPRLDDSGKTMPISMNAAINIASETEDFRPRRRFTTPMSENGSLSSHSPRLSIALNSAAAFDDFQPKRQSDYPPQTSVPDESTLSGLSSNEVKKAIRALPDDVRLLVVLSMLGVFSHGETAQIAGIRLATVKSNLPRGRRLFRESLATMSCMEQVRLVHRRSEEE